jgi:hypothetical protein
MSVTAGGKRCARWSGAQETTWDVTGVLVFEQLYLADGGELLAKENSEGKRAVEK